MSDLADDADAVISRNHNLSLKFSHRDEPMIIAAGYCHYCGDLVTDGRRWCNAECRDNWQKDDV